MKNTKEMKKSQGITLIALVITIIVLLILAGVSIAALTGNNGILTQAGQAKDSNNIAGVKEKVEVEALGSIDKKGSFNKETFKINVEKNLKGNVTENGNSIIVRLDGYRVKVDKTTGDIIGEPSKIVPVKPGVTVSETDKDNYSDGTDTATIPAGFEVDETENIISKGLVVHGPDKANEDNGSEFVWIPVPDINSMAQCSTAGGKCDLQLDGDTLKCITHNSEDIVGKIYATATGNSMNDNANTTYNTNSGLREPAYLSNSDVGDKSSYNTIGLTLSDMQTDYKNMALSVAKYGGFYIGRYELSLTDATESLAGTNGTAQSKQGVIPSSAKDSGTLTWYGLYSKQNKTYTGTNNSVESSMIWGSQYDRVMNWVKEGINEAEKAKLKAILGNHTGVGTKASGNSKDSINNINDLGGNLSEWSLEANGITQRVSRGGSYGWATWPTGRINYDNNPNSTNGNFGSRLSLYII